MPLVGDDLSVVTSGLEQTKMLVLMATFSTMDDLASVHQEAGSFRKVLYQSNVCRQYVRESEVRRPMTW